MNPTMLRLRPLQRRDARALAGWGQDERFCRHAGWSATSSTVLHDFWVRQVEDPPADLIRLAVEDDDGTLVGYVDLHGPDPGEKELGFVIGPSHRRGAGLGRRAAVAGLGCGFTELALDYIWAEALAVNTASVRILRSVGMRETRQGGLGVFLGQDSHYLRFRTNQDDWLQGLAR